MFYPWSDPPPKKNNDDEPTLFFWADYHKRPFALFHEQLARSGYRLDRPSSVRKRYWGLLPYREYSPLEIRPALLQYLQLVEQELEQIVQCQSLAYWLHVYRRLFPGPVGANKEAATIGNTRASLEAAFQKYAKLSPCDRIGVTGQVSVGEVFGGLLLDDEFAFERESLEGNAQLALTNFGYIELKELYEAERLAYEIWRTSAMLRIVGKGASVIVDGSNIGLFDARTEELDRLVSSFDSRDRSFAFYLYSSKGIVSETLALARERAGGIVFLPVYNLPGITVGELKPFFSIFDINLIGPGLNNNAQFNFIWLPFDLRQFLEAHQPYAKAFKENYGVSLADVLVVIAALCRRVDFLWAAGGVGPILRYWLRAYEGPHTNKQIEASIKEFIPEALETLGLDQYQIKGAGLARAIRFWTLNRKQRQESVDLAYSGPHSIVLPFDKKRYFIDYTWIRRRLYDLFFGIQIPDENFKGDALENLVQSQALVLPITPCKAEDNTMKQIDASFAVDNRLVVVECKAISKSIGFHRGDPEAIRYRTKKIDKALAQVDEKAQWLSQRPRGRNYDISGYSDILPIVVTPFVEYIPSLNTHYWITSDQPRVITPQELDAALRAGTFKETRASVLPINNSE